MICNDCGCQYVDCNNNHQCQRCFEKENTMSASTDLIMCCNVCGTPYNWDELGYGHCPTCASGTVTVSDDGSWQEVPATFSELPTKEKLIPPTRDYVCPRCDLDYEDAVNVWGYGRWP